MRRSGLLTVALFACAAAVSTAVAGGADSKTLRAGGLGEFTVAISAPQVVTINPNAVPPKFPSTITFG